MLQQIAPLCQFACLRSTRLHARRPSQPAKEATPAKGCKGAVDAPPPLTSRRRRRWSPTTVRSAPLGPRRFLSQCLLPFAASGLAMRLRRRQLRGVAGDPGRPLDDSSRVVVIEDGGRAVRPSIAQHVRAALHIGEPRRNLLSRAVEIGCEGSVESRAARLIIMARRIRLIAAATAAASASGYADVRYSLLEEQIPVRP